MLIQIQFQDDFETVLKGTRTTIDIEWNETVENLKVHITIKYNDLDPAQILLYYRDRQLKPLEKLSGLNYQEGEPIYARRVKKSLCVLI